MSPVRTLMEVVRLSSGYLESHGSGSPRLDAELLAATALGIRRLDIYLQFDRPLEELQLAAIRELVRRRGDGEPVAHITGEREFHGRTFAVTPDVLIPRPETETLVALTLQRATRHGDGVRIADAGTGSGCVAITLAAELPMATVTATDVSSAALAVAAINVARYSLGEKVELVQGSWCDPLDGGRFDIAVSNPPYIPTGDLAGLERDVRDHEPRLALDGGADGLDAYRALLPSMAACLAVGGWAAVEIDIGAAEAVEQLGARGLRRAGRAPRCTPISPAAPAW